MRILYLKFLCFSLPREGYWLSLIVLYFLVCFCKLFIEYCLLSFQCYLLQFLSVWVQVQFNLIGLAFIRLSSDWLTYLDYLKPSCTLVIDLGLKSSWYWLAFMNCQERLFVFILLSAHCEVNSFPYCVLFYLVAYFLFFII